MKHYITMAKLILPIIVGSSLLVALFVSPAIRQFEEACAKVGGIVKRDIVGVHGCMYVKDGALIVTNRLEIPK